MKTPDGNAPMAGALACRCAAAVLALASACAGGPDATPKSGPAFQARAPGAAGATGATAPAPGAPTGFAPAPPLPDIGSAKKDCCIISGKSLPADPPTVSYRRKLYRFCSPECLQTFMRDPEAAVRKAGAR